MAPHRLDGVAVLRDLMLGNIHTAHDFQAGDHGILQVGRHCQDAAEQTVDTHPHHHLALLRLQMDVTGPLGISPLDEGVDEADGGGGLLRVRRVLRHLGGDDIAAAAGLSLHLLDDPCRTLVAVQAADGLLHGLAGGDHGDDALTGGGFDLILSTKSRGSLMARYRLLRTSFTGTTQYFLAMFRGTYWASSRE